MNFEDAPKQAPSMTEDMECSRMPPLKTSMDEIRPMNDICELDCNVAEGMHCKQSSVMQRVRMFKMFKKKIILRPNTMSYTITSKNFIHDSPQDVTDVPVEELRVCCAGWSIDPPSQQICSLFCGFPSCLGVTGACTLLVCQ